MFAQLVSMTSVIRLKKFLRNFVGAASRPASATLVGSALGIFYLFVSVVGLKLLSGREVVMLSNTVVQNSVLPEQHHPQVAANALAPKPAVAYDDDDRLIESLNIKIPDLIGDEGKAQWQTVRMRVTAYCACRICCGRNSDGRTANMHRIRRGDVFVAADKRYRFGTELIVPGYNRDRAVEVMDRGRVIKGNRLDVFFNSHRTARKWGRKYLNVQVRTN